MPSHEQHTDDPSPQDGQSRFSLDRKRRPQSQSAPRSSRVVLAHDTLLVRRGPEFVLERLARYIKQFHKPVALCTLRDTRRGISEHIDALPHVLPGLAKLPGISAGRWGARWPFLPASVKSLAAEIQAIHDAEPIDLLLSSSAGLIKNLRPPTGVPHLCYIHCPAPFLWPEAESRKPSRDLEPRTLTLSLFAERLRTFDRSGTRHVSAFIANSQHTRSMIERVFNRDAHVVHPPVRTAFFTPDAQVHREDFWLVVSPLESRKRVDIAIEAAARARQRLIIVGDGPHAAWLRAHARAMAKQHAGGVKGLIELVGRLDDEPLRSLYRRAGLFLMPQIEDFGIAAVEAMACGCPVVARAAGGALDTVIPGKSGSLYEGEAPEALVEAARSTRATTQACRTSAERFSEELFDQRIGMHIESALASARR